MITKEEEIGLKRWLAFIAAVWNVGLAGCSGQTDRYAIEGYVVRKEGGSILVVTHISHPNKVKTKDFLFSFSE